MNVRTAVSTQVSQCHRYQQNSRLIVVYEQPLVGGANWTIASVTCVPINLMRIRY